MTKERRIAALAELGDWMQNQGPEISAFVARLQSQNSWYTAENVLLQFGALGANMTVPKLQEWLQPYPDMETSKSVGLVLAGNLPLVGFHDILCVLALGFTAKIKVSSDDAGLTPFVLNKLIQIESAFAARIQLVDKLQDFDLVIATGSNNSARYFEYYFGKKPHIIRKNRNSVAVLTGKESKEELSALGRDIFDFFGLGCRSVSKLYLPKGYEISTFFEAIESYSAIRDHYKYTNNYDYNKSIYLINKDKHFDNGFLLLKEDKALSSPLAVLFYEEYADLSEVESHIHEQQDAIQCVVASPDAALKLEIPVFPFGQSQCPGLSDYADHVDTLAFLWANR